MLLTLRGYKFHLYLSNTPQYMSGILFHCHDIALPRGYLSCNTIFSVTNKVEYRVNINYSPMVV